jgi:hypothetical protein
MDLEQLKIIMETIGAATGAAKTFGIFWLAIQLVRIIFTFSLLGGVAIGIYKTIRYLIDKTSAENSFIKSLRQVACPDYAYGNVRQSQKTEIFNAVLRGVNRPDKTSTDR